MAEGGWSRHVLGVGAFEFRRSLRAIRADRARFVLIALGVLVPSLVASALLVVFAGEARGVEHLPAPDQFRGTVALFWLFGVFLIGQRVVSARTRIEAESLMLTTVSARTVAGGLVVAETLRVLAYLGVPVLVVTGAGVFLLGSPASLVSVPLAAVLFAASAVVAGSVAGYAVALLVARSRFVARHRSVLGGLASVTGMGLYFLFFFPEVGGVDQSSLAWLPVGWFVDLATVGTGLVGSPLRSVGAVVGSGVVLLVGGVVVEREAVALWFTDPVSVDSPDESGGDAPESRGDALAAAVEPLVVPRVVSTPTRRVAEWVLLRTRRDPNRLTFLLIPVFAFGSPLLSTGVQSGSVGSLAAPLFAVALPWLAGSLFAMNPLGDEGAVLPVTLTSVPGRLYVRGLAVPGLAFGLPVVVLVTGAAGLVSPYPPLEQFGLVALGVYLTCVSVALTPAVGMTLPRFSAITVGQSRDVLPPRMGAVAVHAALVVVPGALLATLVVAPAFTRVALAGVFGFLPAISLELVTGADGGILAAVAGAFTHLGERVLRIGLARLQVVGGGALLVGGVLAAVLLYRNAVRRFDRYTPQ